MIRLNTQLLLASALIFSFSVLFLPSSLAQHKLEGLWEGTMTKGGIYTEKGYKFKLYLEKDGEYLKGRTYLHISKDSIIQMNVRGRLHHDRSVSLTDLEFIPVQNTDAQPIFDRKYQLVFSRSIWETTLNGYWQQKRIDPFNPIRKRGRIFLKKIKDKSNKA